MSDEGLRARAQKLYVEWVDDDDDGRSYWEVMADFAQQIREEDCKAVCYACAKTENYEPSKYGIEFGWTWSHQHKTSPVMTKCDAAAIRNLAEKGTKA